MKAKYLIQIERANPMQTIGGWTTVNGAMTQIAARDLCADYTAAGAASVRFIAAAKWADEVRAANRAAFRAEHPIIAPGI